ncbi:MAG: methionine gamma-lyase [Sphingobium sp.]|nr:methionine gamma-lyase [Sphingobium sp.]MCP5400280.1 methionine gamma-lyase [Sphingomonas sp.]
MGHQTKRGFSTRAIHSGYHPGSAQNALSPPLFLTSTFCFDNVEQGGRLFAGEEEGFIYSRLGNPTTALLEQRLASLEGGQAAVAAASGMGAIAATLWTLLRPGDELVTDITLYGCTFALFRHGLTEFGITVTHVDMTDIDAVTASISKRTRVVYFETPANPNMRLVDIAAVATAAHAHGATVVVDNTYATPFIQRPIELGADLVVHSATKYLGGHGDVIAGAVVGEEDLIKRINMSGIKDMTGAVLSPFDAMLVTRGLKTLELRVHRHSASALEIARRLESHLAIAEVHYPGLASFPQHDLAVKQMNGMYGGVIAFELNGGMSAALPFMNRLMMIRRAVSLGDAETLIQHPATMTHSTYTPEERAAHGISEGLIRLSVGLEHVEDIWDDLSDAASPLLSKVA